MTAKEFQREMQTTYDGLGDEMECFYSSAVDLLCQALESLGYQDGVNIFRKAIEWKP